METWKRAIAALLAAAVLPALAAPAAVVEAVQDPAWVERDGKPVRLATGMALEAGDRLRTGDGGRVRFRLGEGSTVKVGQQAAFGIERAEAAGGMFRAVLVAAAGAFRFTTDAARKGEPRDIEIRALNVTAGIRGTDLWGRVTPERQFVVLIEGRIEVRSPGYPAVAIGRPLDAYERRGDGAPDVKPIEAATLAEYAKETEMPPGPPGAPSPGR